jgi:hypothetical protein
VKRFGWVFAVLILACSASAATQTGAQTSSVSNVFAVLTKSAESKSAVAGQELTLSTVRDVVVDGVVVIPRGSKLLGRSTEVKVRGEDGRRGPGASRGWGELPPGSKAPGRKCFYR